MKPIMIRVFYPHRYPLCRVRHHFAETQEEADKIIKDLDKTAIESITIWKLSKEINP